MRKGFTILELLVASLLLGMLMTILTMIFSQSSIAWRTGVAGVAHLDDTRKNISTIRYESDSTYVWDGKAYKVGEVFDENGDLVQPTEALKQYSPSGIEGTVKKGSVKDSYKIVTPNGGNNAQSKTYVVNVMSSGPDRKMDTYDDIWSFPDDPSQWN